MPVRGKRFAVIRSLHQLKTYAIDYSPFLIGSFAEKLPAGFIKVLIDIYYFDTFRFFQFIL